jgi:DNA mismatch endonuclease (patch repair protein)
MKLASMGWHFINIWECQLKSNVRQQTLESLVNTLNYIYLQDQKLKPYEIPEENYIMAAESEEEYGE